MKQWKDACDVTQNLKETESETFSDTKFFRHRIHYFLIPNFFYTESDTFFSKLNFLILNPKPIKNGKVSKPRSFKTETLPKITQIWTKLNPKLFRIPNFFDTESDTFSITNFFDTEFETIHKNEKFWNREFSKSKRHILMKSESLSLLHSAFLVFFNCCQCLRPSFINLVFCLQVNVWKPMFFPFRFQLLFWAIHFLEYFFE